MIRTLTTISVSMGRIGARGAALVTALCIVLATMPCGAQQTTHEPGQTSPARKPVKDGNNHEWLTMVGKAAALVASCGAVRAKSLPVAALAALGCFAAAIEVREEMHKDVEARARAEAEAKLATAEAERAEAERQRAAAERERAAAERQRVAEDAKRAEAARQEADRLMFERLKAFGVDLSPYQPTK